MKLRSLLAILSLVVAAPLWSQTVRVDPKIIAGTQVATAPQASVQLVLNAIHKSCASREFATLLFLTGAGPIRFDFSCYPYSCGGTAKSCLTECASSSDCAQGFACSEKKCVLPVPSCTADLTASTNAFGKVDSCSPLRCNQVTGLCQQRCRTSADCESGFACVIDQGVCSK